MKIKLFFFVLPLFLVSGIARSAVNQPEYSGRNIQIQVEFRKAGFVRQGSYQQTHQSSETQLLVVSDGLEGRLFIGKELPNLVWYRDYLRNEGYLMGQFVFRSVGSSLIVRPRVLGDRIEITLTPEVSYETGDGSGAIAVKKLSTTVSVLNGQSIEIGAGAGKSEFENNFYTLQTGEAVVIVLTPQIL